MKPRHSALRKEFLVLVLTVSAVMLPALASADPALPQGGIFYTVNTTSDTVVIGACQNGNPGCSLRGAIQAANSHPGADGIGFDLPAFSIINLTGALPNLTESVSISGPGANLLTVRKDTGGDYRIFTLTAAGPVTLSGLAIFNGEVNGDGGGILNSGSATVNIINCTIRANSADLLAGSGSRSGGGIFNSSGTIYIINSTIENNSAFSNNGATATGGGIANGNGTVNIINSTIGNNSVFVGGTVAGFQNGGGISNGTGLVNITNSTICHNTANGVPGPPDSTRGAGIYNSGGTVNVKSSIIAENNRNETQGASPDVFGNFASFGFNLIGKNDGAAASFPAGNPNVNNDIVGTAQSPIDPKFDPNDLQYNGGPTKTIALLSDSPAIDKGTSNGLTGVLTTDQRGTGFLRTFDYPSIANSTGGNGTDVGAFELLAPFCVSRKMHGTTMFDINLPLTGTAGVECRIGGVNNDHQVILNFPTPVTLTSASVTGIGSVSSFTVSGAQVTVNLTQVANARTIVLTLFDVNDGTTTSNVSVPMGLLLGDTTGTGSVNASDVSQTKARSGQPVDATNFRTDVTVNGSINASDVSLVKSKSGTALP